MFIKNVKYKYITKENDFRVTVDFIKEKDECILSIHLTVLQKHVNMANIR